MLQMSRHTRQGLWLRYDTDLHIERIAGWQRSGALVQGMKLNTPRMQEGVEYPLVEAGLVPAKFLDSWALNMYHDGSQGIQPHYDDASRFERPVYSLRLFSDSRLSFGTQLYGYTNGAFCVDMPRGVITVMEKGGYAVAGAKHCVRPVDLAGGQ